MFRLFRKTKAQILAQIELLDSMPHSDIYSRWGADRQIAQLTKELNQ